jgi:hypothetical protein
MRREGRKKGYLPIQERKISAVYTTFWVIEMVLRQLDPVIKHLLALTLFKQCCQIGLANIKFRQETHNSKKSPSIGLTTFLKMEEKNLFLCFFLHPLHGKNLDLESKRNWTEVGTEFDFSA